MTEKKASPEFELLQRIDGRLERFEDRFPQIERKAVLYGSAAGALAVAWLPAAARGAYQARYLR
ncbi:hypothetical protein [Pseudomonas aeruginosa]|uniref:hypothetical protein n=1 Tax=Pseudomonas aeruginosa TaxID=287 RepID=UPI000A9C303B|nr:hypothetical protein [Pseudomonas aeruginosa]